MPDVDPEARSAWIEDKLSGRATKVIKTENMGFNEDRDNELDDEIDHEIVNQYNREKLAEADGFDSTDEDEPSNIERFIHDHSIIEAKEKLLECMTMRKPKVLALAVDCFNAVQEKAALKLQNL